MSEWDDKSERQTGLFFLNSKSQNIKGNSKFDMINFRRILKSISDARSENFQQAIAKYVEPEK